jgi:hypothetical protein
MPLYRLKFPDYSGDDDAPGGWHEITVTADTEDEARRKAAETEPGVPWDIADCVQMREPSK